MRDAAVVLVLILGTAACSSTRAPITPPLPSSLSSTKAERDPAAVAAVVRAAPAAEASAYIGLWTGSSVRHACTETGGAVGVACQAMPAHQVLRLRLSQIGSAAEGVLELGGVQVDVSGAIGPNGMLTLTGGRSDDTHTVTITGWRSTADGPVMTGNFGYTIAPGDEALGTVVVTAVLENVRQEAVGGSR